jgi:hypothetical protein
MRVTRATRTARLQLVAASVALCLGLPAAGRGKPRAPKEQPVHFHDQFGNSLERLERVWRRLASFYGSSMPERITVRYTADDSSRFNVDRSEVSLSVRHFDRGITAVLAHETSHLALARMTGGASVKERFRFLDEGLACVLERRIGGGFKRYRHRALAVAARRNRAHGLSFAEVRRWSTYFERKRDFDAYRVGASFVLFLVERHGEKKLWAMLRDLKRTQSLSRSARKVLGVGLPALQTQWRRYLTTVKIDKRFTRAPKIVGLSPRDGARAVDRSTRELRVSFDMPMDTGSVCLLTPCGDSGVCYRDASWRGDRTLVIQVRGKLKPGFTYQLRLGTPGRCRFRSRYGALLPVTRWRFTARPR